MMDFAVFGYTPLLRREIAALLASGPESAVMVIALLMVTKPALWG